MVDFLVDKLLPSWTVTVFIKLNASRNDINQFFLTSLPFRQHNSCWGECESKEINDKIQLCRTRRWPEIRSVFTWQRFRYVSFGGRKLNGDKYEAGWAEPGFFMWELDWQTLKFSSEILSISSFFVNPGSLVQSQCVFLLKRAFCVPWREMQQAAY